MSGPVTLEEEGGAWGSRWEPEEGKMADLEDVTLDGRPLQSLRVADLKAALEERGLSKSGQKNALIKRLKGVSSAMKRRAEPPLAVRRADALRRAEH